MLFEWSSVSFVQFPNCPSSRDIWVWKGMWSFRIISTSIFVHISVKHDWRRFKETCHSEANWCWKSKRNIDSVFLRKWCSFLVVYKDSNSCYCREIWYVLTLLHVKYHGQTYRIKTQNWDTKRHIWVSEAKSWISTGVTRFNLYIT